MNTYLEFGIENLRVDNPSKGAWDYRSPLNIWPHLRPLTYRSSTYPNTVCIRKLAVLKGHGVATCLDSLTLFKLRHESTALILWSYLRNNKKSTFSSTLLLFSQMSVGALEILWFIDIISS